MAVDFRTMLSIQAGNTGSYVQYLRVTSGVKMSIRFRFVHA